MESKNKPSRILLKKPLSNKLVPYLFIFPALLLTIGILYPFLLSLYYSLTDYHLGSTVTKFIGLRNYFRLFGSIYFWKSMCLTLGFAAAAVSVQLILGLSGAMLLDTDVKGVKIARSLIILPLMMPPVVAALMWKIMMAPNGILNYLSGLTQYSWLGSNATALISILIIDTWIYTPFVTVILLAGLRSLPAEPYEAALLDGGSAWFTFRSLTLPMIKPFLILAALFRTIDSLKAFDIIYATTKGGPGSSTMLLQVKAYFESFRHYNMGYALSHMMILWLVIFLISRFLVKNWGKAVRSAARN